MLQLQLATALAPFAYGSRDLMVPRGPPGCLKTTIQCDRWCVFCVLVLKPLWLPAVACSGRDIWEVGRRAAPTQ